MVEDDVNILNLLDAYLERAGHHVVAASDGKEGMELALSERFDLCVLDVMLAWTRSIDIAAVMRDNGINTPIVFLAALGAEAEILSAFGAGVDDYVVKPFSPQELPLRVDAILRRSAMQPRGRDDRVGIGPIQLDETVQACQVQVEPLELTPHEFRIF